MTEQCVVDCHYFHAISCCRRRCLLCCFHLGVVSCMWVSGCCLAIVAPHIATQSMIFPVSRRVGARNSQSFDVFNALCKTCKLAPGAGVIPQIFVPQLPRGAPSSRHHGPRRNDACSTAGVHVAHGGSTGAFFCLILAVDGRELGVLRNDNTVE